MGEGREIVVLGAGVGGLCTALVLANGGHRVTVLERDTEPPPPDDESAWSDWSRPGVNQMRQPHALMTRVSELLAAETPSVWAAVEPRAIRLEASLGSPDPDARTDEHHRIAASLIRRVTLERLLAEAADEHPGVTVRRGVVATDLAGGARVRPESPHVTGVETADHGTIHADLVVDAAGRRSPVGEWVEALGQPVTATSEFDGFTYFARWYRVDGELPTLMGTPFGGLAPGLVALVFPGDGGTCGIAMAGSGREPMLRRLRDPDRFTAVVSAFPVVEPWVDPSVSAPITDVHPMGSLQNRSLRLRTDDTPGVTGLVNTADSVVSTNPSLGRGIGIAADMAVRLRTLLDETADPGEIADRWDEVQRADQLPWLDDSIAGDTDMREAFDAMIEGRPPGPPADPVRATLHRAAQVDMECWRRLMGMNHILETPAEVYGDDELMARARAAADEAPGGPPPMSIDRPTLEALLT